MTYLLGVDIGGTKCAVSLARVESNEPVIVSKRTITTEESPDITIARLLELTDAMLAASGVQAAGNVGTSGGRNTAAGSAGVLRAAGISCGSPLDSRRGMILSPPNLPGWDRVDIATPFGERYGIPVQLQNDANACALAEWTWGAGKGSRHMIFLTFGTGMGAGLILDGRLYTGARDMAGEVGHIRLAPEGPIGFGKAGSFEGFCSGGGIARLGRALTSQWLAEGVVPAYFRAEAELSAITAKSLGEAAAAGDPHALEIWKLVAGRLGEGLSVLIDVLNPELIVIGSIYARQRALLDHGLLEVLKREALEQSLSACRIVPAALGEAVGDYAGLSVALMALGRNEEE